MQIRRRDFLGLLGGTLALNPRLAVAQEAQLPAQEQVDRNIRWFLLNSRHPDYGPTRAILLAAWRASTSAAVDEADGRNDGEKIIKTYMTPEQKALASPPLTIGTAAVLDEFNYSSSYNAAYAPRSLHTNKWGDTFPIWGVFLEPPMRLPTTGEDRRLAHAKGVGTDSILYVGQSARGSGNGSSYSNRRAIKDILANDPARATVNPTNYTILVLCGRLSRFANEGDQAGLVAGCSFTPKTGTPDSRTIVISHPVDQAEIMGGCKLGCGIWGEDADWTPDGGGRWHIHSRSSAGGGTPFSAGTTDRGFVMSDAGGSLRALTQVASADAVSITPDSWYIREASGNSDVYVRLADGSNPKDTTYFEPHLAGGIYAGSPANYVDYFGLRCYQMGWFGAASHNSHYNCWWGYTVRDACIRAHSGVVNESTGEFSHPPQAPDNRKFVGCRFQYAPSGIYDACGGHDAVPSNTTVQDCYFADIGIKTEQAFGINITAPSDAHSIATMGTKVHTIRNNRIHNCAWMPIVHYAASNNFADPVALGLAGRPGFVRGLIVAKSIKRPDSTYTFQTPCYGLRIEHNWITDTVTPKENPGLVPSTGMGISLNGDSDCYGFAGQIRDIKVRYNRIEGAFNDGAIRTKYELQLAFYPYTEIEIAHNTIRGAARAFRSLGSAVDENGQTVEPSFWFHHNDVHATKHFVMLSNASNPARHRMVLEHNVYRIDDRAKWQKGSNDESTNLLTWRRKAPQGNNYDNASTTAPLR